MLSEVEPLKSALKLSRFYVFQPKLISLVHRIVSCLACSTVDIFVSWLFVLFFHSQTTYLTESLDRIFFCDYNFHNFLGVIFSFLEIILRLLKKYENFIESFGSFENVEIERRRAKILAVSHSSSTVLATSAILS